MPGQDKNNPLDDAAGAASSGPHRYRFANVEYDESTGVLQVANQAVPVERLPLNLLAELLRRPNQVVMRTELFDRIWHGRPTVDHVLANAVNKLRKALGDEGAACLVNVPRVGYRLAATVQQFPVRHRPKEPPVLAPGQPVPGRDAFILERELGAAAHSSVWLARDKGDESDAGDKRLSLAHVFKFANQDEEVTALKREAAVYRVLRRELGERADFARVLAENFSSQPFFLECEYGGTDLASWAAEGNRLASMTAAPRIALFLQIARAVAAAHSVGVLHKDLKPANVLIAAASVANTGWEVRLTDFGSSRILGPERLAQLGLSTRAMVAAHGADTSGGGTPLYLAPELLAGQPATTGSDVYALGLMLYQLLVGDFRRPMSTGWERDIHDPLLVQGLRAATEGNPEDRLASAAELIERLNTLEARRAEQAARDKSLARANEAAVQWQRSRARRPWIGGAIASLALGLATSLWYYSQASAALGKAKQESARAQAINDFLHKDVLQSPDVLRSSTRGAGSMFDVLQRASQQAAQRFNGQPRAEASARRQLGAVYLRMHYLTQADK